MRTIAPDPYGTWEWRTAFGQPASPPASSPATLDEIRIAHNLAVITGDRARAAELRARIDAALTKNGVEFTDGLRMVGTRLVGGVQPRLEAWFEARGAVSHDAAFAVRGVVEQKRRLSMVPVDAIERDVADAMPMSPKLWKEGCLYRQTSVLRQRIGTERFFAYWVPKEGGVAPRRQDGAPTTDLVTLR